MFCSDADHDCDWEYMQKLGIKSCVNDCWYWKLQREIKAMKVLVGDVKEEK